MTLGGFIPYAEDDLGGLWSADLRSHLSAYGGFFSNVGLVRKQFFGGMLGGIGVYWDYDGDQGQYPNTIISDGSGSYTFAGGQTYQQVGVSGELLTDWGNLRSNGYIPCGTTASVMGPFVGNSILSQYGINAALAGADLEVGAYVPGLSDWAGMVSVGGYTFGNARYDLANGQNVVPYFGGVYTRLDMTFLDNWDFSLQANNDSYFDWTGFARLTYRMGASRRRNVPDQMEQPMMRNEHIVRAHQAPVQAINPFTNTPWRVIHVDNSMPAGGTGTNEAPVNSLAAAQDRANQQFDIVFVYEGDSRNQPYATPLNGYQFQNNFQMLVGEGTGRLIPTANAGMIPLWAKQSQSTYPTITNPFGPAIVLTNAAGTMNGATVDHLRITGSQIGISDGPGLPKPVAPAPPPPAFARVNDVQIVGTGPGQRGVEIRDAKAAGATVDFTNVQMRNLTNDGFFVDGSLGSPRVNITNSQITNTGGSGVYATDLFGTARVRVAGSTIDGSTGPGVYARDAGLTLASSNVRNAGTAGVAAEDNSTVQVVGSTIEQVDVGIQGTASTAGARLNITINNNTIKTRSPGNAIVLSAPSPTTTAEVHAYVIGNQISSPGDDILLFDGSSAGAPGSSDLWLKAADRINLGQINRGASIREVFPASATPQTPAPPNYDPSLVVPLPSP
jgi:hypothetical protein